jgi:hypothetical protein
MKKALLGSVYLPRHRPRESGLRAARAKDAPPLRRRGAAQSVERLADQRRKLAKVLFAFRVEVAALALVGQLQKPVDVAALDAFTSDRVPRLCRPPEADPLDARRDQADPAGQGRDHRTA